MRSRSRVSRASCVRVGRARDAPVGVDAVRRKYLLYETNLRLGVSCHVSDIEDNTDNADKYNFSPQQ
jgi:hypothetical protein